MTKGDSKISYANRIPVSFVGTLKSGGTKTRLYLSSSAAFDRYLAALPAMSLDPLAPFEFEKTRSKPDRH